MTLLAWLLDWRTLLALTAGDAVLLALFLVSDGKRLAALSLRNQILLSKDTSPAVAPRSSPRAVRVVDAAPDAPHRLVSAGFLACSALAIGVFVACANTPAMRETEGAGNYSQSTLSPITDAGTGARRSVQSDGGRMPGSRGDRPARSNTVL